MEGGGSRVCTHAQATEDIPTGDRSHSEYAGLGVWRGGGSSARTVVVNNESKALGLEAVELEGVRGLPHLSNTLGRQHHFEGAGAGAHERHQL